MHYFYSSMRYTHSMSKAIIQLNEEIVKSEIKELVRNSVEDTLNELLNKEAEELTNAGCAV